MNRKGASRTPPANPNNQFEVESPSALTNQSALFEILRTNTDNKLRKDAVSYLLKFVEEGSCVEYGEIKRLFDAEKNISVAAELKRLLNKLKIMGKFGNDPISEYDRKLSNQEEIKVIEEIDKIRKLYDRSVGEQGAFDRKYKVFEEIDKGGMGRIYRGARISDNKAVVIKYLLLAELAKNNDPEKLIARFKREGELLTRRLKHTNVVAAYEYGEADGEYFIVMEYVDSGALEQLISENPLGLRIFKNCAMQLCDAVEYIHENDVIHRDIKPLNILVSDNGGDMKIKLADFGLAKDKRDGRISKFSFGAGTEDYSSPQQLENATLADQRDDIYSIGKTFYQMLTSRTFGHNDTYEDVAKLRPDVPEGLDCVILKCIEAKKEDRYQKVSELRNAIDKILVM